MTTMKIPPSPINKSQGYTVQNMTNRVENSVNYAGDNRPKSVNRNSNNWKWVYILTYDSVSLFNLFNFSNQRYDILV